MPPTPTCANSIQSGTGTTVSISVCICTHNRAGDCRELLRSLAGQTLRPPSIIVVDSCSDEAHSRELRKDCEEVQASYVRLDQPGLSLARNAAAAASRADWIAYLDDDTLADNDWYDAAATLLSSLDSDTVMVGGRVDPLWPEGVAIPSSRRWRLLLSCVEDREPGLAERGANICGANLFVRRDALSQIGGFPTALGRVGEFLLSGEESYVVYQFIARGRRVAYEPSISVRHKISKARLTRQWAAKRAFWEGVTRYRLTQMGALARPAAWSPPQLAARVCGLWLLKSLFSESDDLLIRFNWARGALHAQLRRDLVARPP